MIRSLSMRFDSKAAPPQITNIENVNAMAKQLKQQQSH